MKTGNDAERMLAGQWRRAVRKFETAWSKRRLADARDFDRLIAELKKFEPQQATFRRAVVAQRS